MRGRLLLVLHAHLPFVRHPEHPEFLEEDWLYEAVGETYLPLLQVFDRLAEDGVPFRLTLSLSPTLLSMLRDSLLMERYVRRLDALCELAGKELRRTRHDATFASVARFYHQHLHGLREAFHHRYRGDLVRAFRRLQDAGHLEIITTGATHGFLPLMQNVPEAVRAQLIIAIAQYRQLFGRNPQGIWLPECGYYPGLDRLLARQELRFFFVDSHGLMSAQPAPTYGVHAPVFTEHGVAAFGRDVESSQQVWSADHGYPGDPMYREFYRDIGWELELDYLRPYLQASGERKNTGLKYYRITGRTEQKCVYEPEVARQRAVSHAAHFLASRVRQFEHLGSVMPGQTPVVVAPYDAELFGHWWFEGPWFLDALIRQSAEQDGFVLGTAADHLQATPEHQLVTLGMSSWGERGYASMWLDGSNDWIYRYLHPCAERMVELARDFPATDELRQRALNQAARELLLAQSSDWAFIMKTGTMVDYAVRRTKEHLLRFLRLHDQIRSGTIDRRWLEEVESRNNLFPEIDYRVYRPS